MAAEREWTVERMADTFKSDEEYIFKAEFIEDYGLRFMPTGESIVRCKDCKHRPIPNGNDPPLAPKLDGWSDYVCPCLCDDEYYNFMPDDDGFCSRGERKESEE